MDHARALRTATAERDVLGELTPEEHAEFEQHFFDCCECAWDVETLVAIGDEARAMGLSGAAVAPPAFAAPAGDPQLPGRWRRVPLLLPAEAVLASPPKSSPRHWQS